MICDQFIAQWGLNLEKYDLKSTFVEPTNQTKLWELNNAVKYTIYKNLGN